MKRHQWTATLVLTLLLFAGGVYLLWDTGFFEAVSSLDHMRQYINRFAPYSHLFYFVIQFLSVIVAPIPSNITALAGAVLFGTWPAFLLTAAAVLSGSMSVFFLARVLGRSFADKFVSKRVSERYLEIIRRKRDIFLILVFLFPFFPDDLICILAGLTDIGYARFLLIVTLTRPWGLLAACALGGSAFSIPIGGMVLIGILGIVLFAICLKYGDKWEAAFLKHFQK